MSNETAKNLAQTTIATPPAPVNPAATPESAPPASTIPANLAKKEAEIVRKQLELKKQQEEWSPKLTKAEQILKIGEEFESLRKTDPVAALKKLGFSETEIFNFLAAQEKPEPTAEEKAVAAAEAAAQAKIKEFEEAQAKKQKEDQELQDKKTLDSFKSSISEVIKSDPEKFEYCHHKGAIAEALIYQLVLQSVADSKGKEALSALEATELAEQYYEEEDKSMATLKKRTPVSTETPAPKEPTRTRTVSDPVGGTSAAKAALTRTRTLTNNATATVASTTTKRPETPQEKRARLEAILRNGGPTGKS